ncbi:MAG: hypothetical protein EPN82_11450 [Bacteroidetes bacterium]|nr:MAG: hypothetical protein EPN82_11450 [Bacteroidota bacterium]
MAIIDFVTVVNEPEIYENNFLNNININNNNLVMYDNNKNNITITERYNDYINNKMQENTWVVFCHQDFEIQENVDQKLELLDKNCIYGPVGAATTKNFVFFLRLNGLKIAKSRIGSVKKTVIKGQIIEKGNNKHIIAGHPAKDLEIVDTLDCCCFIVHSSTIKKMNFLFDEKLDWHLYSEDLCLFAKTKHNIYSRIINIKSTHYSSGNFNSNFYLSLAYLKEKYKENDIISTVYDGSYMRFLEKL